MNKFPIFAKAKDLTAFEVEPQFDHILYKMDRCDCLLFTSKNEGILFSKYEGYEKFYSPISITDEFKIDNGKSFSEYKAFDIIDGKDSVLSRMLPLIINDFKSLFKNMENANDILEKYDET